MKNEFIELSDGTANVKFTEEFFDGRTYFEKGEINVSNHRKQSATFSKKDFDIMKQMDVEFRKIIMKKGNVGAGYLHHFGYWKEDSQGRRFVKLSEIKRKLSSK